MSGRRIRVGFFTTDNPLGHSGIDRYTTDLLRELSKHDDLDVVPVASPRGAAWIREDVPGIEDIVVTSANRGPARSVEERYRLRHRLARAGIEVVHGTKHILPIRTTAPTVLTVYDLFAFTRRADYRWSKRLLLPPVYRQAIRQADRIIVMTESIRRQLTTYGLAERSQIDVVPAAPSSALTSATPEAVPQLVKCGFALSVGDLSVRKNIDLLLRIWPRVHNQTGLTLALVGPDRSRSEAFRARLTELEAAGIVARIGSVNDGALRWCYEHARVALIPSFEEGYGLPAIEARHFGAPLVTSCDPALVEVSGNASRHVAAVDDQKWGEAIAAANEAGRNDTASTHPTWNEIAEQTARVYREALGTGR